MNKSRFYIEKISVQGESKSNAEIKFEKGVNLITGSSDSGKSFVFKCIDYILGAETPPKVIPEARGYSNIYLQIKTNNGERFTLQRNLKNLSDITYTRSTIENFKTAPKTVLGRKNNTKNGNNISEFLLSLIDINEVYLKAQLHS